VSDADTRRARAAAGAVDQSVPPRTAVPATPARLRNVRRVRLSPNGWLESSFGISSPLIA
jgi:hypothetical protein